VATLSEEKLFLQPPAAARDQRSRRSEGCRPSYRLDQVFQNRPEAERPVGLVEGNRYRTSVAAEIITSKYGYVEVRVSRADLSPARHLRDERLDASPQYAAERA
jgi:hypothetical protein